MKVLQDYCESGSGEADDRGHLAGKPKNNQQDQQCARRAVYRMMKTMRKSLHAAPVKPRAVHEMAHQSIEENDAKEDESNQRKGLQQQVQYDAMLQQHLSGPFAVNGGELLLSLDTVIVDAEKLALGAPGLQAGEFRVSVWRGFEMRSWALLRNAVPRDERPHSPRARVGRA